MTLRGDDRAVAVQIGAVILLGFIVVSLSLYQATVVPNENQQVEFQHNQRVQSDMLEVRNAILGTAATGSAAPATVELGTRYPARVVAVNPAPPSGTLSTSSLGQISVRNATADDADTTTEDYPETADFWNGTTHNYTTKSLEYRPSYANYDNAPTTVYENGLVYNRFRGGNVTRSGQPVVAGTRISLVALSGNLSQGGASSLLVDPQPVSVSTRTISVTNDAAGENVSVVVPSELSANEWRNLLNETGDYDPAADSSNGAYVYRVADRTAGVELYFESGATYQLKLSKVGVGQGVGDTDPAYLTSAEDLIEDPFVDRTYPFVVEVRDRYNNPVSKRVNASVDPGTVLEPGRYRYQYSASSVGRDWVNVTYVQGSGESVYQTGSQDFNGELRENVQYDVNVQAGGGGGGNNGNTQAGQVSAVDGSTPDSESKELIFDVRNTGTTAVTITDFSISTPGNQNSGVDQVTNIDKPPGQDEVQIGGGYANPDSPSNDNNYQTDGRNYGLNQTASLSNGGTVSVTMGEFNDGNIQLIYELVDSEANADITVGFTFEDGSTAEIYFRVTNVNT